MPAISGSRTRSIIGRVSQPSTTRSAAAVMPRCASAAIATAGPCAPSPTACCRWPAPCSSSRHYSTPATRFATPPAREPPPPIPLFDPKPPSLRPDLPPGRAPRAVAVQDAAANAAASAEPARTVLDRASTVLARPGGTAPQGVAGLPPRSFSIDHWWEVPWLPTGAVAYRSLDTKPESQAIRSVIRMIATTLPSLNACSFVSLLQVQQKFFFAVKILPS